MAPISNNGVQKSTAHNAFQSATINVKRSTTRMKAQEELHRLVATSDLHYDLDSVLSPALNT